MFSKRKELLKLVGTIVILFIWVFLFGARADDISGKLLVGSMFGDVALIAIWRVFVDVTL